MSAGKQEPHRVSVVGTADSRPVDDAALDTLFRLARSQNGWFDHEVDNETLYAIHDLAKMGPTSMNCSPMRLVFVRSPCEKRRLLPAISEGNRDKIRSAPVVAIIGADYGFHASLPKLFPHRDVRRLFEQDSWLAAETAFRNGTLQAAYLMLAARALGLDCGPISGFDAQAVNRLYFDGTAIRVNFLCGLGHGNPDKVFTRLPRFGFHDVCRVI